MCQSQMFPALRTAVSMIECSYILQITDSHTHSRSQSDVNREHLICRKRSRVLFTPQRKTVNWFNHLKTHLEYHDHQAVVGHGNYQTLALTSTKWGCAACLQIRLAHKDTRITNEGASHLALHYKCPINSESNKDLWKLVNLLDKHVLSPYSGVYSCAVCIHWRGNREGSHSCRVLCFEFYSYSSCRYN